MKPEEMKKQVEELESKANKVVDENTSLKAENEKLKAAAIIQGGEGFPNIFTPNINSDEKRAMAAYGCNHPTKLLNLNTANPRFKHVAPEFKSAVLQLKSDVFVARAIQQLFHGGQKDHIGEVVEQDRISHLKGMLESSFGKDVLSSRLKAFGTGADGAQWIPTAISSDFIEEHQLELNVPSLFDTIDMPTNPYKHSIQTSKTTARKATEGGQATGSSFSTSTLDFNAIKLYEYYPIPEEITEDSAPNLLAVARTDVINAQIRALELSIVNGDTTGTHQDSDTHAEGADVAGKFWKGLRKLAIANSANGSTPSNSGGAVDDAFMKAIEAAMGKFSINPREFAWILSTNAYNAIRFLTNVSTVEKFGPLATILRGALAAYDGRPIVISEFGRNDLNASGVYDGVTQTNPMILGVNSTRFKLGRRRPIRVRVEQDKADYDRMLVASYSRYDFVGFDQGAAEVSVASGINVIP